MQAEMMLELRDQLRACVDNPSDPRRYDTVKDLCGALANIIEKNSKLIKEINDDIEERKRMLKNVKRQ